MKPHFTVAIIGVWLVATNAYPFADEPNTDSHVEYVSGVFIPADIFQNLQDKARQNQEKPVENLTTGNQVAIPVSAPALKVNDASTKPFSDASVPVVQQLAQQQMASSQQPLTQYQNPKLSSQQPVMSQYQQSTVSNQPVGTQPLIVSQQPLLSNHQPSMYQQPIISQQQVGSQPSVVQTITPQQPVSSVPLYQQPTLTQQVSQQSLVSNQPGITSQQPVLTQQPIFSDQQLITSQQPINQALLVTQPNQQTLLVGQPNMSTQQQIMVSQPVNQLNQPNNQQGSSFILQPGQLAQVSQPVYTNSQGMKPLQNSGTTLFAMVPVQQVSTNPVYSVNSGK